MKEQMFIPVMAAYWSSRISDRTPEREMNQDTLLHVTDRERENT